MQNSNKIFGSLQTLDDVQMIIGQKQLTTPDCLYKRNVKFDFSEDVEERALNGSGWRYSKTKSMNVKKYKKTDTGDTSYFEFLVQYRSNINFKTLEVNYCDTSCILYFYYLTTENVSLTCSYIKFLTSKFLKIEAINFGNGLHFEDMPKLEGMKNTSLRVIELDEEKATTYTPKFLPLYKSKNTQDERTIK